METPEHNTRRERLEEATSRRLAQLRDVPVDTDRLLRMIEAEIPRESAAPRRKWLTWLSPIRAAAASLLVFTLIAALVISSSSGPVLASADQLAQIHQEVLAADGSHVRPVTSIADANAGFSAEWPGAPMVPELPNKHARSCCIHRMGQKRMACVMFEVDGVPVTMAVAAAADVKLPAGETRDIGGVTYHVQSHEGINMIMTERGGRWVCLMGEVPINRLVELAPSLRF